MRFVYVAGPLAATSDTQDEAALVAETHGNIRAAADLGRMLSSHDMVPFVPHLAVEGLFNSGAWFGATPTEPEAEHRELAIRIDDAYLSAVYESGGGIAIICRRDCSLSAGTLAEVQRWLSWHRGVERIVAIVKHTDIRRICGMKRMIDVHKASARIAEEVWTVNSLPGPVPFM